AWDANQNLIKLNPIADWSLETLETYVADNAVPINALHSQGFPSIGCQPCTRAIRPGEDIRAGRWWWENEDGKECGLHNRPKVKDAAA
ncbi:MAG TPA: phosphoadenosine phosphosulfate reductase family protein, partial [Hyphomicrobium sp.]|nr:phosphoadenosine phosphosulfate reductase family protein [Hyphomicrobium sp.]